MACCIVVLLAGSLVAQEATPVSQAPPQGPDAKATDEAGNTRHWVVTTAGDRIETRGPFRIDGRRVVFTDTRGALRSIRRDQLDLSQSGAKSMSEDTAKPDLAPEPKTAAAALVLDERTISTFSQPGAAEDPSDAAAGSTQSRAAESGSRNSTARVAKGTSSDSSKGTTLEVASWEAVDNDDAESLTVYGTLKNRGPESAKRPGVTVFLVDERGERIAQAVARITRPDLAAGKTTNFRAQFAEFVAYTKIEFEITQ